MATRIHNFSLSLDGFAAGEPQSLETPFGHAGQRLHAWMMATRSWDSERGTSGVDEAFAQQYWRGIGAEIMGANKFGPPGWQDDPGWRGWWGEEPPFHTPVIVLTHHAREPLEMGDTTFHFLTATPAEALCVASEAAGGQDVRIGGGATVVRDFMSAGLVDHIHLVQVPIVLGRGTQLWEGLEGFEEAYDVEATASPSGVTHLVFTRKSPAVTS